ncbi:SRCN1 inhibitor, partial [Pteruthius melanotis]|nr:SRCN1 inhibitor [Pteruthius melanotis]
VAPETDFSKGLELEMPTSPPVSLHHLTAAPEPLGVPGGFGHSPPQPQSHGGKSNNPSRAPEMVPAKTQTGPETPGKKSADKAVSVEAAERDWEEKRAALTQYSAKDINRLLEETQAELMKAIPDLEFAAKHKQAPGGGGSAASTPEHKPSKPQHAPKSGGKGDPNGRRGSDELTVPRYRTEKPSKSPPPPPPRRSFPSSHGLTTTRSGEVIVTSKKEPGFMKKAESEELETQKPQVKLRRTVSEVVRPASTPPIIASAIKDDDEEDRIIAELEVFQRSSASPFLPTLRRDPLQAVSPGRSEPRPDGAEGWKPLAAPASRAFSLPQIVLTEWVSEPPSPEAEPEPWVAPGSAGAGGQPPPEGTRRGRGAAPGSPPKSPLAQERPPAPQPPGSTARAFPLTAGKAPPFPRDETGGQGGDAALDAAGRAGGSGEVRPRGPGAAQPPRSLLGRGAGAAETALPSGGTEIVPQIPGDGEGARLPPGHSPKGAWREENPPAPACPVPHPGIPAGRDAALRGAGHSRAEQPLEQIPAGSSHATAAPGWDGGAPAAAGDPGTGREETEGLCRIHSSPGRGAAPGKKEIYEDTYQRLDSLEETIRELEMTISEISSHPAVELVFPRDARPGSGEAGNSPGDLGHGGRDGDTALDLSRTKDGAPKSPSPSRTKPALLPKPQLPPGTAQSGGVSIPAMKVVNPASRLKQGQQGSPDKGKHIKQRMEYMRIQGQQQVLRP